jgi:hypothetical protein
MTLDTGLSYSMVPQEDINFIEQALEKQGIVCKEEHHGGLDLYDCSCSDEQYNGLKPFVTQIGDKDVEIPVSSFLKKKNENTCTLLMYPNDVSMSVAYQWVMGDLFLQNFYTIFDMKGKRIGLVEPKE